MAPAATAMMMAMTCLSIRVPPAQTIELHDFEEPRGAHAAADAHRDHREFRTAPFALDQRVPGEPRAGHAVWMAERDRPAVHVEPVIGDAELVAAVDHLHGEGLVEFPQVDVRD